MLIGFSMCDGRHVAADKESTRLYRECIQQYARSIALRSPSRQQRCRSLVFVIIIADEYKKRMKNRVSKFKEREGKQTK